MGTPNDNVDRRLARIAGAQHGVVTRRQLLAAGVTVRQVQRRLRRGALLRVHPGVYRVGHAAPSTEAAYQAAVLGAGERAGLSGRAAAYQWRLLKGPPPPPEVSSPGARRLRGVVTHRSKCLDLVRRRGIPLTTVPSTLVDLAAVLAEGDLARACHEAGVLHRTTPRQVEAVLARRPNAPGAHKLRAIMGGEVRVLLSALERGFLRLLRDRRFPLPQTNKAAGGRRVDCRWPERQLTVELDSYAFHNSRHSWEQDRRREREAGARGDEFRRYTWGDVFESPKAMLAELGRLLCER